MNLSYFLVVFFARGTGAFLGVTFFFAGSFFFRRFNWTTYKNKHTEVKEKYSCKQCTSVFTTRGSFDFHVKFIHAEIFIFCCDKCDETFTILKKLNHNAKEKHFKYNKNLNITNMGNFDCNEYDKTFKKKKLLKKHKKRKQAYDSHRTPFSAVATFFELRS